MRRRLEREGVARGRQEARDEAGSEEDHFVALWGVDAEADADGEVSVNCERRRMDGKSPYFPISQQ